MTYYAYHKFFTCKYGGLIQLFLCWITGICTGFGIYITHRPLFYSLMRGLAFQPVSIVGLFVSVFLPFLFTYFFITTNKRAYILVFCFLKALSFGFTGAYVISSFGSAGWLMIGLFMFSDCCTLPLLYYLWISTYISHEVDCIKVKFWVCTVLCLVVVWLDFVVISPFLHGLF